MKSPDDEFECRCGATLRKRDLHAIETTVTTKKQTCRKCGNVFEVSTHESRRNEGAIFRDSCFAIDAWLGQVEGITFSQTPDGAGIGTVLWTIDGLAFPGRCEIVWTKSSPEFAVVRLCVDVEGSDSLPEKGKWYSKLNAFAVQATGATGTQAWWGASQSFKIDETLLPGLFGSVIDRLKAAIDAVSRKY